MEGVDLQQQHSAQLLVQRAVAAGRRRRHVAAGRARPPYPQAPNPNNWYTFNYGTQRNTWGGNGEFSGKTPWFIRADYNEVKTNGIKPGSGQLGTGSGNGLIELGVPVDYKTQNTTIEGGYNSRQYGFKLAFIDSKFTDANDSLQWTNFYMRSGLDTSLLPPDNELKKWSFNGYIKQLPWDSAIIARFTQSKLTNSFGDRVDSSLKPTGNAPVRPGASRRAWATSSRSRSTPRRTRTCRTSTATSRRRPPTSRGTRARWRSSTRASTTTTTTCRTTRPTSRTRQGSQGSNCATPPVNSATCYTIAALTEETGEAVQLHEERGGVRRDVGVQPHTTSCSAASTGSGIERHAVDTEAPKTDDYRYWVEYRNTGGWDEPDRPAQVRVPAAALRPRSTSPTTTATSVVRFLLLTAYDVNNFDRNMVKLNLDWTPAPMWFVGFGATWRDTDYKDNFYGRTKDNSQQYDVTVVVGRRQAADHRHRQLGQGRVQPGLPQHWQRLQVPGIRCRAPNNSTNFNWGTQNTQDGWMAAALVDWAPTDKLMLTDVVHLPEDQRRRRLQSSGNTDRPAAASTAARSSTTSPTTRRCSASRSRAPTTTTRNGPSTAATRTRSTTTATARWRATASYYPYFQNLNTAAVGRTISWYTGAFANPATRPTWSG